MKEKYNRNLAKKKKNRLSIQIIFNVKKEKKTIGF